MKSTVKQDLANYIQTKVGIHVDLTSMKSQHLISSGFFSYGNYDLFKPIIDNLLYEDPYFLLADYQFYVDCQEKVDKAHKAQDYWS